MTTQYIYAAATTGEILVFESYNTVLKPESMECKLLGKVETVLSKKIKNGEL